MTKENYFDQAFEENKDEIATEMKMVRSMSSNNPNDNRPKTLSFSKDIVNTKRNGSDNSGMMPSFG